MSLGKDEEKYLHMFSNLVSSKKDIRKNCFQILVVIRFLFLLLYCHLFFDVTLSHTHIGRYKNMDVETTLNIFIKEYYE